MQLAGGAQFAVVGGDLALRLRPGEFPFLQVELAILVEVEALEQFRRPRLPFGEQQLDVLGDVEIEIDAAARGELAEGIDFLALDEQPFCVAAVALDPGVLLRISISAPSGSMTHSPEPSSSMKEASLSPSSSCTHLFSLSLRSTV